MTRRKGARTTMLMSRPAFAAAERYSVEVGMVVDCAVSTDEVEICVVVGSVLGRFGKAVGVEGVVVIVDTDATCEAMGRDDVVVVVVVDKVEEVMKLVIVTTKL
jgi:hypothetical protein